MPHVVSLGTMLVEIMRINLDEPFSESVHSPVHFQRRHAGLRQRRRTPGQIRGFHRRRRRDGFGDCILNRFAEQGVDATHVRVLPDRTTGIAFVSYASDGSRQFIFHWRDAAAGQIGPDYVERTTCATPSGCI